MWHFWPTELEEYKSVLFKATKFVGIFVEAMEKEYSTVWLIPEKKLTQSKEGGRDNMQESTFWTPKPYWNMVSILNYCKKKKNFKST